MPGCLVATRRWLQRLGSSLSAKRGGAATARRQADLEIDRGVELRIVELHQHVVAGNPQMGGAEGDESGHVEAAHTDDIEPRAVGGEAELAGAVVREGSRSEEHTSELQSLMRISYAVFCLKKKQIRKQRLNTSTRQQIKKQSE